MSGELSMLTGPLVVEVEQVDGSNPVHERGGAAEVEAILRSEGVDEQGMRYLGEEVALHGEAMLTLFDGTWIMLRDAHVLPR